MTHTLAAFQFIITKNIEFCQESGLKTIRSELACPIIVKNNYFLGFSKVVTPICIFAEYNLALDKYEGYLAIKFT